jgi:hypothetical protein
VNEEKLTRDDVIVHNDSLPGYQGHAKLIEVGGQHYVVSATVVMLSGPEVLVFKADPDGKVTDWLDVAGIRGTLDHEDAIAELLVTLGGDR